MCERQIFFVLIYCDDPVYIMFVCIMWLASYCSLHKSYLSVDRWKYRQTNWLTYIFQLKRVYLPPESPKQMDLSWEEAQSLLGLNKIWYYHNKLFIFDSSAIVYYSIFFTCLKGLLNLINKKLHRKKRILLYIMFLSVIEYPRALHCAFDIVCIYNYK